MRLFSYNCPTKKARGFSLVEMLVVIAVLGIIVAMVVPVLAGARQASDHRDHRNAQAIATMAGNAIAAGDLSIPSASSIAEVVDLLLAGVGGSGAFEGTIFRMDNLDGDERAAAIALLRFEGGAVVYQPL